MAFFKNIFSPSILAADHAALGEGLRTVLKYNLSWVHLDIMDGNFVPNISFGPQTVKDLRKIDGEIFFDTHLMLVRPDKFVEKFIAAGSQLVTIHVEPNYDVAGTLKKIRELGCLAGISLNPDTPAEKARALLPLVDLVLVMSVFPGFGGQAFIESAIPKIETLAKWRNGGEGNFRIQVDGGIDATTAPRCLAAGADTLVAGTAFFKAHDKPAFIAICRGEK
ncbi:MAG: ribulose-phosphate 3-epimerase [Opitutae bacterium]|nr:ribulose-phosphate 3-epimerase [Opitutae bacterium]